LGRGERLPSPGGFENSPRECSEMQPLGRPFGAAFCIAQPRKRNFDFSWIRCYTAPV